MEKCDLKGFPSSYFATIIIVQDELFHWQKKRKTYLVGYRHNKKSEAPKFIFSSPSLSPSTNTEEGLSEEEEKILLEKVGLYGLIDLDRRICWSAIFDGRICW